jgi:outer membrane protein assembly factor BamD (BamD/ComL family)
MPLKINITNDTSSGQSIPTRHGSYKKIFVTILLPCLLSILTTIGLSSEKEIIELIRLHLKNGEYYNAITESMRYQYVYPDGDHMPESMLLMGKAYFLGKNYVQATKILNRCYDRYKRRDEGEEALYTLAYMRTTTGSPFYALRLYQQYQYIYKNGRFLERVHADKCYALALMNELDDAKNAISDYYKLYPDSRYSDNLKELELMIQNERERPKKSIWVSFIGSVFLPGFGHFYTENYTTGALALGSNAALIYLIYDSYQDGDGFRLLLFTFLELSFYQYSLFSSIRSVHEYNSREEFHRNIILGIRKKF